MDTQIEKIILEATGSSRIVNTELIQNLWSGYGQLNRVVTDRSSVILKFIKFPDETNHPRGWNTNISHQRKEKSYRVEMNWYESFNNEIESAYSPRLITRGENSNQEKWIILEDLKEKNFTPKAAIEWEETKLCLKWLAKFHLHYLNKSNDDLWQVGTYWHLETRPDELEALDDLDLKNAAFKIDEKLNEAKYQTLVHGDAKLANFLFNGHEVAAVDFQYVGGGVGIKDVAYFLSSIYYEEELKKNEDLYLDYYFSELNNKKIEKEWRELYPYAWCDFYRFLKGWSPGHYKLNSYSEQMKNKVLSWI